MAVPVAVPRLASPNAHDWLLHRPHSREWHESSERLTAALLPDGSSVVRGEAAERSAASAPAARPNYLFLVHGYAHAASAYKLQAAVLRLSNTSSLLRQSRTLLYVNDASQDTAMLIDLLRHYQPRTLRMLIHTRRDIGHHCSEFQLLAATARFWLRHDYVVCEWSRANERCVRASCRATHLVTKILARMRDVHCQISQARTRTSRRPPSRESSRSSRTLVAAWRCTRTIFRASRTSAATPSTRS